ncbi:MAG: VCBS repeat-containing protein [Cyclobacteriaceae bacterium]
MRLLYILLFAIIVDSCTPQQEVKNEKQLYTQIASTESGLTFENRLSHDVSTKENLFDFDYFYNGAGLAVADFDNDGLQDLIFCGNQVPNRVYKNLGNLKFEDVTEQAGINEGKEWSNGVSIVDINGDNLLDIYISQGGPYHADRRSNLLLINQGGFKFVEQAADYGLNDKSISTQTAFLDYDNDGDLDCLVMNQSPLYGLDPLSFFKVLRTNREMAYHSSSHFYRNDNGKFVDVTAEVGLQKPSFGLGLAVADLNNDGWDDIYMANDYFIPDAMYINQGDGHFYDESKDRISQTSFYGMGIDIADINNDLKDDIMVLDMASADHYRSKTLMASMNVENFSLLVDKLDFNHQYMFNSFHLNSNDGKFVNTAHQMGIAKTDWSWTTLMNDLDNDGDRDIFVTNGYRRYALDNDFKAEVIQAQQKYNRAVPLEVKEELYYKMPSEKLPNLIYRNDGNLSMKESAKEWGITNATYSNGAICADLDNDGDIDIVVNNLDEETSLYVNNSNPNSNHFIRIKLDDYKLRQKAVATIFYDGQQQRASFKGVRGYFSYTETVAHFGIGSATSVDSIRLKIGDEQYGLDNVKANQVLAFSDFTKKSGIGTSSQGKKLWSEKALISHIHKENNYNDFEKEVLLPYKQSTSGPIIERGDINGDGLDDLFIGGNVGFASHVYLQHSDGFSSEPSVMLQDFMNEAVGAEMFDVDHDGDLDIYVQYGGNEFDDTQFYQDVLYLNVEGSFTMANSSAGLSNYPGGDVESLDIDNDGWVDLIVGNRVLPQSYPIAAPSYIYLNREGTLVDATAEVAPALLDFGIINDIQTSDFDNDGDLDLFVVGEWTEIGVFENINGKFERKLDEQLAASGWWFSITETDVNNDGWKDYIIGNVGLNTKFSASKDKPFKVFANDFDKNGTLDIVLSKKYKGEYVPVRGKECSTEQMPFISEKFKTYNEFASATIEDIFENAQEAVELSVTTFESVLLINNKGNFESIPLPAEAQLFPFLDAESIDMNGDGIQDIVALGNIYNTEVETPRWDGGRGLVMMSDGGNGYLVEMPESHGFQVEGNAKTLTTLKTNDKHMLLVGVNNGPIRSFELND